MKTILTFQTIILFLFVSCSSGTLTDQERWQNHVKNTTIIRDNWGVPHIYGKTDADAVFGLMYAQCEDDFNRVEVNYINSLGRMAEVTGEKDLFTDLRMRLFIDTIEVKKEYDASPGWLKELMTAFADGVNYYLYTHPDKEPLLLDHFEPWMALTFSEGSIGGDIESVSTSGLRRFYDKDLTSNLDESAPNDKIYTEPRGSNGFAIAPSISESGNALLLINPHTSFYFRSEVHMVSEEGLNAYGAVTWGQFFVYQGFNEYDGWMHTSSRADVIDRYEETVINKDDGLFYKYGDELRPVETKSVKIPFRNGESVDTAEYEMYFTQHGPVIASSNDKWISVSLMVEHVKALSQSYLRTKTKGYDDFKETMEFKTNSSNNTVFADKFGNIAYFHGNFMPIRDTSFNWSGTVDGSNPATDWKGLHDLDDMVSILNPPNGWIQNCNSTPFTAAGEFSPKKEDYPSYMAPDQENARGLHAVRVLKDKTGFTLNSLIEAAFDPYLTAFEKMIPALVKAFDSSTVIPGDRTRIKEAVDILRDWDLNWGEESVATSVAIYWGQEMMKSARSLKRKPGQSLFDAIATSAPASDMLEALGKAIDKLESDFGDWKTPWGEINRFQRINGEIRQPFNDDLPSLPVGFTSSRWGSLASFGARTYPGTVRMYGTSGNSFVAVVEFGDKVIAKSVVTGGQSSDTDSPHFDDQALMYTKGEFKDVLFYRDDVEAHAEKTYRPGEEQ